MSCKWDREKSDYLVDGEPCRYDSYGDATVHCTAKKTCAHHVGTGELTCGRCLGDTRFDISGLVNASALMPIEALTGGVNSEAANIAGPAADPRVFSARRAIDRRWLYDNIPDRNLGRAMAALIEDDDTWHPFNVLTKWHWLISAAYNHPLPEVMTVADSAAYLERNLHRVAQDGDQEFAKMKAEVSKCRKHMESVLRNSSSAEKGAPCPTCSEDGKFIRLVRSFGHWCWDDGCEKIHYADTSGDRWTCPKDKAHWWTEQAYRAWVEERTA